MYSSQCCQNVRQNVHWPTCLGCSDSSSSAVICILANVAKLEAKCTSVGPPLRSWNILDQTPLSGACHKRSTLPSRNMPGKSYCCASAVDLMSQSLSLVANACEALQLRFSRRFDVSIFEPSCNMLTKPYCCTSAVDAF